VSGRPAVRQHDLALPHGITLRCRAAGEGRVRALLLHGFPEAAFVWDEVMQRLAPDIATLAPNLRGYAGSSAPAQETAYRARELLADLVAVIEHLGAPVDLLVAHDWGGALAWVLAAQRPDLMRRLLIVNAPHPAAFLRELRDNPRQIDASAYMNFLSREDAADRLAENGYARLWPFFADAVWLTPALRARYREVWDQGLQGPTAYYRMSPLKPSRSAGDPLATLQLPAESVTVRVPTDVLWGEADRALLPGLLDGLEHWVPDLHVERVADASHWIVHERPDLLVAAIRRALHRR
jgi:pimeloyl-ACP methyl ester carboxylesterase